MLFMVQVITDNYDLKSIKYKIMDKDKEIEKLNSDLNDLKQLYDSNTKNLQKLETELADLKGDLIIKNEIIKQNNLEIKNLEIKYLKELNNKFLEIIFKFIEK